jgi:hypothetical protein
VLFEGFNELFTARAHVNRIGTGKRPANEALDYPTDRGFFEQAVIATISAGFENRRRKGDVYAR